MRVWVCGNLCKRVLFVVTVWGIKWCAFITRDQAHPLKCPWWQTWSSASGCRWCWSAWCSSCTRTPPGPCTACGSSYRSLRKPEECTTCQEQELESHIGKLTFCRLLFEHCLFCKRGSLSFAHLLSRKQIALGPFEGRGRGKNCGSGCSLVFFVCVVFLFFFDVLQGFS